MSIVLDNVGNFEVPAYPPYNIERVSDDEYRVTMAVAGFGRDDISIEVKQNTLTVSGKKADKTEQKGEFLHQGIAQRAFERRFQLADYVQVEGAELDNGLLHIALKREIQAERSEVKPLSRAARRTREGVAASASSFPG